VRSLHGSLRMSCTVPGVGMVSAKIAFTDCSFDNRANSL
jgi:hypothetical protein